MYACARVVCGFRPIRGEEEEERRQGGGENRGGKKTFAYSKMVVREVCGLLLRWNECVRGVEMTPFI